MWIVLPQTDDSEVAEDVSSQQPRHFPEHYKELLNNATWRPVAHTSLGMFSKYIHRDSIVYERTKIGGTGASPMPMQVRNLSAIASPLRFT